MAGFETSNNEHLIRSSLWSKDLKDTLEDDLIGMRYVRTLTDFPDGDVINIPSIGQAEVLDFQEGEAVKYTAMDTGNFQFQITQYKSSGTFISNKMKQDTYYMNELVSSFVPKQSRAIAKSMETRILNAGPDGQTAANVNAINGANHRFIGGGTNEAIEVADFARARFALQKANVPMTDLVAIVDPSCEFTLSTLTNLTNVSNNKRWEGIVREGMSTGTQFIMNVYGFDVYVSQNLKSGLAETIDGKTTTVGVGNLFFSATQDVLPFVGLVRQPPRVDSEFNKDLQQEEYVTTARYDFTLFRPENMVTVITDTNVVS